MNEHGPEYIAPDSKSAGSGQLVKFPSAPAHHDVGRSRGRYWVAGGLLVLLALALACAALLSLSSNGTIRYTTVPASQGAVTRAVTATGTVNPELTIIVGTYVSGVIKELYCDYNTQVKKGQVCAKIDPRPYQTLVNQAKANLAIANAQRLKDQANLGYEKIVYDRNLHLIETHAISQDVLDNARSQYEQAEAQIAYDQALIEQRQAELDSAQVNLEYTDIASPVDGTVVSRNVTMGQTVAASFQTPTLFLIASDLKKMQVDTNISESDIGDLRERAPATFTVDAFPKRTFRGKVSQVRQSPQTVQNVVTFDVVVSVDNSDLDLKPGMTAATRIMVDQRTNVMRVPSQALRYVPSSVTTEPALSSAVGGGPQGQIWILRDGEAVAIPVEIGIDDESFVEIASGNVKPGDQVIIAEQRQASGRAVPLPRF